MAGRNSTKYLRILTSGFLVIAMTLLSSCGDSSNGETAADDSVEDADNAATDDAETSPGDSEPADTEPADDATQASTGGESAICAHLSMADFETVMGVAPAGEGISNVSSHELGTACTPQKTA